jgi:type I restriction enzyme, S subunit
MQPSLRFEDLVEYKIILPPLSTQTTIANFLDNKTDKISTFIKNKKETIKLLQEQKQAIIHKAVTTGLEE